MIMSNDELNNVARICAELGIPFNRKVAGIVEQRDALSKTWERGLIRSGLTVDSELETIRLGPARRRDGRTAKTRTRFARRHRASSAQLSREEAMSGHYDAPRQAPPLLKTFGLKNLVVDGPKEDFATFVPALDQ